MKWFLMIASMVFATSANAGECTKIDHHDGTCSLVFSDDFSTVVNRFENDGMHLESQGAYPSHQQALSKHLSKNSSAPETCRCQTCL